MFSNNKIKIFFLLIMLVLISCDGTLGGFNTLSFPISKKKLEIAFDNLYLDNPDYKIPNKFQEYNFWSKSGYDFLESRIFYFKENPEEMYYVSFIGEDETFKDTTHIDIAIRSVFIGSKRKWLKQEDFSKDEENRIQTRFKNEIISKLEKYTKSKAKDLGY
jgi:hypothetical protein